MTTLSNLPAGKYTIVVTHRTSGCKATVKDVEVKETTKLTIDAVSVTDVLCFGASTGSAKVTATTQQKLNSSNNYENTNDGLTYTWYNNLNPSTHWTGIEITNKPAGTYTVELTNEQTHCTVSRNDVVIGQPAWPLTVNLIGTDATCYGGNGSATLVVNGGNTTGGYTLTWTPSTVTATSSGTGVYSATGLSAGSYSVVVKDRGGSGCAANSVSVTINEPDELEILNCPSSQILYCDPNQNSATAYIPATVVTNINDANYYTVTRLIKAQGATSYTGAPNNQFPTSFDAGTTTWLKIRVQSNCNANDYDECEFYIQVNDNDALELYCPDDVTETCVSALPNPLANYAELQAVNDENTYTDVTQLSHSDMVLGTSCNRVINRTYSISKEGKTGSCLQVLMANDNTPPVFDKTKTYTVTATEGDGDCGYKIPDLSYYSDSASADCSSSVTFVSQTPEANTVYAQTGSVQEIAVTVRVQDGCGNIGDTVVTVIIPANNFTAQVAADEDAVCYGGGTTLRVTPSDLEASNYSWNPSTLSGATPSVTPTVTTTYRVTVTGTNGCEASAETTVTVNHPSIELNDIMGQTTVCNGGTLTLIASTSSSNTAGTPSWQWYKVSGNTTTQLTGETHAQLTINDVTDANAGKYRVVGTNTVGTGTNACPATDSKDVTVTVLTPTVTTPTVTASGAICKGDSATLTASATGTNVTYAWSPISGLSANSGATVKAAPSTTTTYQVIATSTVAATDGSGVTCSVKSQPGSVEVVVNELSLEVIDFGVYAGETAVTESVCPGTPLTLKATVSGIEGQTLRYRWGESGTFAQQSFPAEGTITLTYSVTPSATINYTLNMYVENTVSGTPCSTDEQTVTVPVSVYPAFDPGAINGGEETICLHGNAPTITSADHAVGGNGGPTYHWQVNTGEGGAFVDADSTNNQLAYKPSSLYTGTAGVYLFRRVAHDGTCATHGSTTPNLDTVATGTFKLVVLPAPSAVTVTEQSATGNGACAYVIPDYRKNGITSFIAHDGVTYPVDADDNGLFPAGGRSYRITQNPAAGTAYVQGSAESEKIVTITITDACDNVATQTTRDTIPQRLTLTAEVSPTEVCAGTEVTFTATATSTTNPTFQWPEIPGHDTYDAGNNTFTYTPSASGTFTVNAYGGNGCPANTTVTVTVDQAPAAFVLHAPQEIQSQYTGELSVRPLQTGETIAWQVTSIDAGAAEFTTSTNTNVVTLKGTATGQVKVVAVISKNANNENCRSFSDSVIINIVETAITVNCPPSQTWTYDGDAHQSDTTTATGTPITVVDAMGNPVSNVTLQFSTNGTDFSDEMPSITNVGDVQVTVQATTTVAGFNDNTCQYSLTVNKRPVRVEVADCGAYVSETSHFSSAITSQKVLPAGEYNGVHYDSLVTGHSITAGALATNQGAGGVYSYNDSSNTNTAAINPAIVVKHGDEDVTANYDFFVNGALTVRQITETHTDVTCHGSATGAISLTAIPSESDYTYYYIYNNTEYTTTNQIENLKFGTYKVFALKDGCSTDTLTVPLDEPGTLTVDATGATICYEGIALLSATATGGHKVYDYSWVKKGQTNTLGTTATIELDGLTETAEYVVTAADRTAPSCLARDTVTVTVRPQFNAGAIATTGQNLCYGNTTGLLEIGEDTQASGGDANYTYSWRHNGQLIGGATSATYKPADADATTEGEHTFTRRVHDGTCNLTPEISDGVWVLTVYPQFNPGTINGSQEDSRSVCYGGEVLTINGSSASGGAPVSEGSPYAYKWQVKTGVNGEYVDIDTATGVTFDPTSFATVEGTHTFRRMVKNIANPSCGDWTPSVGLHTIIVHPNRKPNITVDGNAGTATVCASSSLDNNVLHLVASTPTYNSAYHYTWSFGEDEGGSSAHKHENTVDASWDAAGTHKMVKLALQDNFGCIYRDTLWVNVNDVPALQIVNPVTTLCQDSDPITLSASLNHTTSPEYTYLWDGGGMSLGTAVSSENGTVSTVTASLQASYVSSYTVGVKVTDSKGCSAQASPITITVDNPTVTLSDIDDQTICAGTKAPFTAQITGLNGTPSYKWMNAAGDSLTNTQGYQTSDALVGDTIFTVVAYATVGACVKTDTTTAKLHVLDPQVKLKDIDSVTICKGGNGTTLTAVLDGEPTGTVSYEWSNGTSGTDATSITENPTTTTDYTVVATATVTANGISCPKTDSKTVTVTVNDPQVSLNTMASKTVCYGGNTSLTVSTNNFNADDLSYEWKKGDNVLAGEESSTLTLNNLQESATYTVTVTATKGECPKTATATATVTVLHPTVETPTFTGVTTICQGGSTDLTVSAAHDANSTVTYHWEPASGLDHTDVDKVHANPTETVTYTVVATATTTENGVPCTATSQSTVTVTVNTPQLSLNGISIYDNSNNTEISNIICKDTTVKLTANTTVYEGNTNTYTWKKGTEVLQTGTSADYVVTPQETTTYTVEVYAVKTVNNLPCITAVQTKQVTITVNDPQVTLANIPDTTICYNTPFTLTADATFSNAPTYTWTQGESTTPVQSGTNPNLTGTLTDTTVYHVTVTVTEGACTVTATDDVTVNVLPQFNAGSINAGNAHQEVCYGTADDQINAIANTAAEGGKLPVEYQWYHTYNNVTEPIADSTAASLTPKGYNTQAGTHTFTRKAKDQSCNDWTESVGSYVLTVYEEFKAGAISGSQTICSGGAVNTIGSATTGVATGGHGAITYEWYHNDETTPISGATEATFTPSNYNETVGTHTFHRWAINAGCIVTKESSGSYTLNVNAKPTINITGETTVCASASLGNNTVTLTENTQTQNTSSYTYVWYTSDEGAQILSGQGTHQVSARWSNQGTGTISLLVANNSTHCESTEEVSITVYALPEPQITGPTEVCQNSLDFPTAIELTATPANMTSYEWTGVGASFTAPEASVTNVSWNSAGENKTVSVKVTDSHECSVRAEHTVTVNTLPILNVETTSVSCNGGSNGTITATVLNDVPTPYSYTLDGATPASTTGQFTGLSASTSPHHTVVVTDGYGCKAKRTNVAIDQSAGFTVVIDSIHPTGCSGQDGWIRAKVEGSGMFDLRVYNQNNEPVVPVAHNEAGEYYTSPSLPIGTYTLKVNAYGESTCIATKQFEVVLNDTLKILNIDGPNAPVCSGSGFDAPVTVNITDNTTYYSWEAPGMNPEDGVTGADGKSQQTSVNDEDLVNNTTGVVELTYHVVATNGLCRTTGDLVVPVSVTVRPPVTISAPDYYACPDQHDLTLTSQFTGVVSNDTKVTWTFQGETTEHTNVTIANATDALAVTLPDGYNTSYHYTVEFEYTDIDNCSYSDGGDVFVPSKLEMVEDVLSHVTCFGGDNGSSELHAVGGWGSYTYSWNSDSPVQPTGENHFTKSGLAVPAPTRDSTDLDGATVCGDYTVTIKDARGCQIDTMVTICSPAQLAWKNCPQPMVVCCDDGQNYATVIPGTHFTIPTLNTMANVEEININNKATDNRYYPREAPYMISYVVEDVCHDWDEIICVVQLHVLPNPSVEFANQDLAEQPVCFGNDLIPIQLNFSNATLELTGALPHGVTFDPNTGVISGTPDVEVTTSTEYAYTITATSDQGDNITGGCGVVSINGKIIVNPGVQLELTSLTPESCIGGDGGFTVKASGGQPFYGTHLYLFALGSEEYGETPTTVNTQPYSHKVSDTYTVRVKDPVSECETSLPVTVTLNSPYLAPTNFVFEPVTATNICSGTTFTANPTAPWPDDFTTTYTWTAPTGNVSGGSASDASAATPITSLYNGPLTNSGAAVDTAYYTLIPTTGAICVGEPFTVKVPVNPTVVMNTPESRKLCHGDQFEEMTFSTSITDGTMSYSWTNDKPSIGLVAADDTKINAFTVENTTESTVVANLSVTPTYTNGVACPGNPVNFTITVNPQVVMNTPANQVLCHGDECDPVNFSTTIGDGQMSYSWTRKNANVTGLDAQDATNIPATVLNNTTNKPQIDTFIVTPTYTNNGIRCTGNPVEFTMTVNPKVVMTQPMDTVVCHGSQTSLSFTSNLQGGTMGYTWECDNPTIGLAATGDGETLTFTAANTGTMARVANIEVTPSYTANGKTCTGEPVTFKITVNPQVVMNTPVSPVVCNGTGTTVNFSTTITGGTMNYVWTATNTSDNNGNIGGIAASGSGNISATALVNNTTTEQASIISVTPSYTNGVVSCTATQPTTFTITVNPSVTLDVTNATQENVVYGNEITPIVITNTASEVTLSMTAAQLAAIGLSYNETSQTISGRPKAVGTYNITATANSTYTPNCGQVQKLIKIVVGKRDLEIVINDAKDYDGTALVTNYNAGAPVITAAALQNGATLTAGAVTTASANANTYTYTGTTAPVAANGMTITTPFETSDGIGNYNVRYNFTQTINKIDATVTVTEKSAEVDYDGQPHTISGYASMTSSTTLVQGQQG